MRAVVVVPARDEEKSVGACVSALAAQAGVGHDDFAVVLVLDGCTDATAERALAAAAGTGLRLLLLAGPREGVGGARRAGMDLAWSLLPPGGLIASSDADTVVAPDWLARQLDAVAAGADAVGGWIELDESELHPWVVEHRRRRARERLARVRAHTPGAEHHHFAGASMALTAAAYERVGGIEPLPALEDEALERALRASGLRVARTTAVRVRTSARLQGRAAAGLAMDLAAATAIATARPGGARPSPAAGALGA